MKERETFGSRLGFILVSAGCAIGLGNVWKFPYITGQYGGAMFILIYLIFLAIFGLPILVCEFGVGRGSGKSMATAFGDLEAKGTKWHHLGWFSLIGSYVLMMFYTMVGGWMLFYVYRMVTGKLAVMNAEEIGGAFGAMLGSAPTMAGWMIAAVVISFLVCAMGLQNGIEKITKVMMAVLIVLMIVLAIRSIILPGSAEGLKFYLIPTLDGIREHGLGTVLFAAMAQAFFTLSIGIGSMQIFGSYMKKDRRIMGESISIICVDTFVALMAGIIIIPACFAFGIEPGAGPSLLFITLPNVFNSMAGGQIWGTLFFIFMSFAAITTIIAVFENILMFTIEKFGWNRKKAVIINLILVIVLSLPAVLGFNVLSGVQLMGPGTTIMDVEDFLVSYNLLPLGSLVFVMFCVRKNGWGWDNFIKEVNTGEGFKFPSGGLIRFYMSVVLPIVIGIIYIKGYYDFFIPQGIGLTLKWMILAVVLLIVIFSIVFYSPKKKKE